MTVAVVRWPLWGVVVIVCLLVNDNDNDCGGGCGGCGNAICRCDKAAATNDDEFVALSVLLLLLFV